LQHLWTLLTTEEVFREDGTSPRQSKVRKVIGVRLAAEDVSEHDGWRHDRTKHDARRQK
jgi:hypothetical protein